MFLNKRILEHRANTDKGNTINIPFIFVLFCFFELNSFVQIMSLYHAQTGQGIFYIGSKS